MKSLLFFIIFIFTQPNQQDDFIFTRDNQKVTLKIDNGERNVYWNIPSVLNFKFENIEKEKVMMSAPGISFKKGLSKKDELELEITPKKKLFKNDSLKLNFGYYDQKNEFVHHEFLVLIK